MFKVCAAYFEGCAHSAVLGMRKPRALTGGLFSGGKKRGGMPDLVGVVRG